MKRVSRRDVGRPADINYKSRKVASLNFTL